MVDGMTEKKLQFPSDRRAAPRIVSPGRGVDSHLHFPMTIPFLQAEQLVADAADRLSTNPPLRLQLGIALPGVVVDAPLRQTAQETAITIEHMAQMGADAGVTVGVAGAVEGIVEGVEQGDALIEKVDILVGKDQMNLLSKPGPAAAGSSKESARFLFVQGGHVEEHQIVDGLELAVDGGGTADFAAVA